MDPTLKTQTLERLKGKMPDLAPRLRLAAKYIIDHPADFGLDAIRTTGRKAGVSTYTLVRLAEAFDFESYEAFRAPFRQALVAMAPATARPDWLAEMGSRSAATAQARAVENTLGTVNRSLYQQDPVQMVRLADAMLGARMVYLTASRASYALAYFLHYVGRMALPSLHLIPRHMNSPIDELSVARPGDMILAITFTPYSRDTVEACRFAQSRGVRLALLTDSDVAVPDLAPEETLVASTLSTHYFGSYTGAMAVLELLIATLIDRAGPEAIARIDAYGKLRRDHDFYWARPQKT